MLIHLVNAFSHVSSGGSPTGIVTDARALSERQMQQIADQVPASHTAFIFESDHAKDPVMVRFFTRGGEIVNCGHGTIAAHYLRSKMFHYPNGHQLFQQTRQGLQQVDVARPDHNTIEVYLKQNEITFTPIASNVVASLLDALALAVDTLDPQLPVTLASPGANRFLVAVKSVEGVDNVHPDFEKLNHVCRQNGSMGCFLYSIHEAMTCEVHGRMFAPPIGVNEDVINGNSSGCVGAYLLQLENVDKLQVKVYQGSKFGSEGVVYVKNIRQGVHTDTFIGGTAFSSGSVDIALG